MFMYIFFVSMLSTISNAKIAKKMQKNAKKASKIALSNAKASEIKSISNHLSKRNQTK